MARDRNLYVWQAYVIVMSFVSLLCIGALAYIAFQAETNYKSVQEARKAASDADLKLREEAKKSQMLEMVLGARQSSQAEFDQVATSFSGNADMASIQSKYLADMALLGPNVTEKNYRKLVETLMQTVRERNLQVDAQAKREEDLKAKYDATIKQETDAREAERKRANELAQQLEQTQVAYAQKEKDVKMRSPRSKRTAKSSPNKLRPKNGLTWVKSINSPRNATNSPAKMNFSENNSRKSKVKTSSTFKVRSQKLLTVARRFI